MKSLANSKHKCILAGIPVQVTVNQIYEMDGNLNTRAKTYFGKLYSKRPYANMVTACYIDNYVSLLKFVDDEEERKDMAWGFTRNSMSLPETQIRPDKMLEEVIVESDSIMKDRMVKLLDKFQNGWCGMRYLMNLERHEKWTVRVFFDEVINRRDIDHVVGKTFKQNLLVQVNILDFCEKYYCQKYSISLEDLDI